MVSFKKKRYRSKNTKKSNIKRWSKNARKSRIKRLGRKLQLAGMEDVVFTKEQMVDTVNKAIDDVILAMLSKAREADEMAERAVNRENIKASAERRHASQDWVEGAPTRDLPREVRVRAMAANVVLKAAAKARWRAAEAAAAEANRQTETSFTMAVVANMVNTAVNRAVEILADAAETAMRVAEVSAGVARAAASVVRTAGVKAVERLVAVRAAEELYSAG